MKRSKEWKQCYDSFMKTKDFYFYNLLFFATCSMEEI